MKQCRLCKRTFKNSSRHSNCSSCRKKLYRNPCPNCGQLKQRKSVLCRKCFSKSKEFPASGTKHVNKNGYVYVYFRSHPSADKEGRLLEHRLVMEKILGRQLFSFESVHHKNGVRDDNRPENLELWIKPQPTGGRVEDIVKWARQVIKLYGGVSSAG